MGLGLGVGLQVLVLGGPRTPSPSCSAGSLGVAPLGRDAVQDRRAARLRTAALGAVFTAWLLDGPPTGGARAIKRVRYLRRLDTVFVVAASIIVVAFLLAWLIRGKRPLRQTVDTAGVGEASSPDQRRLPARADAQASSRLVEPRRTRCTFSTMRTVAASGVDLLRRHAAWLLVQHGGRAAGRARGDALTGGRSTPRPVVEQVGGLTARGLVADAVLTEDGHATADRLMTARKEIDPLARPPTGEPRRRSRAVNEADEQAHARAAREYAAGS